MPFEFDRITIAEIDPGERFLEVSTMGSFRSWRHERTIEAIDDGRSRVTDTLEFEPRFDVPGFRSLAMSIVGLLFDHRHRRLAKHFS